MTTFDKNEYIYVMQLREFISQKMNVYKIGRTCQNISSHGKSKRCSQYPKGSKQIAIFAVQNSIDAEKQLIMELKQTTDI